jgi:hypothetical protein
MQAQRTVQPTLNILAKLKDDSLFEDKGQQILIFLTKELYEMKRNDNNNDLNNSSYYVLQNWYHRCSPKGGLELADKGDQSRFLNPLNLIEKAINFLRRRFDRFEHKNTFDELSELIKISKINENEFGVENDGKKFNIWKKRKVNEWKVYAEFYSNYNLIKTKMKVKWKKRRRKINSIVSLLI